MLLKLSIIICFLCLVLAQKYHTVDDDYDEDAAVKNVDSLKTQFLCFNDKGPCSLKEQSYKNYIADAIQTSCQKCLPHHEHEFKVFLAEGKKKVPAEYEQFKKKYDPDNKYLSKLDAEISKY